MKVRQTTNIGCVVVDLMWLKQQDEVFWTGSFMNHVGKSVIHAVVYLFLQVIFGDSRLFLIQVKKKKKGLFLIECLDFEIFLRGFGWVIMVKKLIKSQVMLLLYSTFRHIININLYFRGFFLFLFLFSATTFHSRSTIN